MPAKIACTSCAAIAALALFVPSSQSATQIGNARPTLVFGNFHSQDPNESNVRTRSETFNPVTNEGLSRGETSPDKELPWIIGQSIKTLGVPVFRIISYRSKHQNENAFLIGAIVYAADGGPLPQASNLVEAISIMQSKYSSPKEIITLLAIKNGTDTFEIDVRLSNNVYRVGR